MPIFDRTLNCYFCTGLIRKKDKHHMLGAKEGDQKIQCQPCYNREAKLRCKKRKLKKRYF